MSRTIAREDPDPRDEDPADPSPVRLVAVSNRLPVALDRAEDGSWTVRPGSGGLVTALAPVLRNRGGTWIGWPGIAEEDAPPDDLDFAFEQVGYRLRTVDLTAAEIENFYLGFANRVIWPLFHDLLTRCHFAPEYWYGYLAVNEKFARAVARHSQEEGDYVWVHDYHLMHVAQALRALDVRRKTGFFLHIPFPPVDIFLKLPWREEVLRALLEYDLIGFQTVRDRTNFAHCVQHFDRNARIRGRGQVATLTVGDREVRLGSFPISIDFRAFAGDAATPHVAERAQQLHEPLPGRRLILGVDRLDYTKGIPNRLEAFRNALRRYPELHERTTLVQVVVPSRGAIPEYQELKATLEQLVGEINGQFTRSGWVPIHYLFRSLDREELLAYYRAADVALVTPLKDGMNLVAKEYCACKIEDEGALILSEFAGAAAELQDGATLVNPFHIEAVADAIHRAVTDSMEECRARMRRLREIVRRRDIFWWVDAFLRAAFTRRLEDFPERAPEGRERTPEMPRRGSGVP